MCSLKCATAALRSMLNLLILHEHSITSNSQHTQCVMSKWIINKPVSHTSKATSRLEHYSISEASDNLLGLPNFNLVSRQLFAYSHQSSTFLSSPLPCTKHLDIDPSPLSDRTRVISSPKNTSTDVNLIMCGRKSQETNGERGINSSQLAAARHLMLTLKLCQKSVKCLSTKERFILHHFSLFTLFRRSTVR